MSRLGVGQPQAQMLGPGPTPASQRSPASVFSQTSSPCEICLDKGLWHIDIKIFKFQVTVLGEEMVFE